MPENTTAGRWQPQAWEIERENLLAIAEGYLLEIRQLQATVARQAEQIEWLEKLVVEREDVGTLEHARQHISCGVVIASKDEQIERLQRLLELVEEWFSARGIGMDWTLGCFVCGGEDGLRTNVSGFVRSKSAGEHVVEMFRRGARLDYREREPNWIQVKIGACPVHVGNLELLQRLTVEGGCRITWAMVKQASEHGSALAALEAGQ